MSESKSFSGFVALIGRPNVGKSTLLNSILGEKVSITSRKPQTTRHQILGIKTEADIQIIFIDTPGIHIKAEKALNRYMNKAARAAISSVDVLLHLIEVGVWTEEDEKINQMLVNVQCPKYLVINKIDTSNNANIAQTIAQHTGDSSYDEYIPVSAQKRKNLDSLLSLIKGNMPESAFLFPSEQVTDKSIMFQFSESIRERLMFYLHKEIPYSLTVQIEKYEESATLNKVHAVIWVERNSQKGIVIGKQGEVLKKVGEAVRKEYEKKLSKKIFIQLWVKVKEGWADKENLLKSFGYTDKE